MQQEKTGHVAELALLNPSLHDRNGIEVKNEHQSGNNDVEAAACAGIRRRERNRKQRKQEGGRRPGEAPEDLGLLVGRHACKEHRHRLSRDLAGLEPLVNLDVKTYSVLVELDHASDGGIKRRFMTAAVVKNDVAVAFRIDFDRTALGSHRRLALAGSFSHEDAAHFVGRLPLGLDEEDTLAAHRLDESAWCKTVDFITLSEFIAGDFGLGAGPRRNDDGEHAHGHDKGQGEAQDP